MTCERYETDLALHVEGDLDKAAALRLEEHLAGCDRCRTFLHELQLSQRAVKAFAEEPVPEEALRRVRSRVEGAISLQSRPRAAFSPAWGWALAASVALVAAGAAADLASASSQAPTSCRDRPGSTVGSCSRTRDAPDRSASRGRLGPSARADSLNGRRRTSGISR